MHFCFRLIMNVLYLPFLLAMVHFLMLISCGFVYSFETKGSHFIKHSVENVLELINSGSVTEIPVRHTQMECLALCTHEDSCSAVIVDPKRKHSCFLYKLFEGGSCPIQGNATFQYLAKVMNYMNCYHGGIWNIRTQMCQCIGGWIGLFCSKLARTCHDLVTSNYSKGYKRVYLDLHGNYSVIISVVCYILPSLNYSRLIVMRNHNGVSDFRFSWNSYVSGFSNSFLGFWLGLNKMYLLSSTLYRTLHVLFMLGNEAWFAWQYNHFTILDASRNYPMYFSSSKNFKISSGNDVQFGDCLTFVQNISFSTWDKDNDLDPMKNCANLIGAGWWYMDCEPKCNPLGRTPNPDAPSMSDFKLSGLDRNISLSQDWTLVFYLELQL